MLKLALAYLLFHNPISLQHSGWYFSLFYMYFVVGALCGY